MASRFDGNSAPEVPRTVAIQTISDLSHKYSTTARKWKRYSFDTIVKIVSTRNSVKIMIFGRTENLSEGGLGLYTPQLLELEETVQMEFELPTVRSAAKLAGVVKNNINGTYGVEFRDPPPGLRKELSRACQALSSLQVRSN